MAEMGRPHPVWSRLHLVVGARDVNYPELSVLRKAESYSRESTLPTLADAERAKSPCRRWRNPSLPARLNLTKSSAQARFRYWWISGPSGAAPAAWQRPTLQQVARDLAGRAVVLKVDTEKFPELAARFKVQGIPNFAVFANGELKFQQAGLVDANTMKSWLTRAA